MGIFNVLYFTLIIYISYNFNTFAEKLPKRERGHDLLWCSHCGVSVGDSSYIFTKSSPGAIKVENRTILGKDMTVQTLMNPLGFMFDVITTEKASCLDLGYNNRADSWFPGYTWRVCTCPHCSAQLGWTFEKVISNSVEETNDNQTFHALITRSLLGVDNEAKVVPLTHATPSVVSITTPVPTVNMRAVDEPATEVTTDDTADIFVPKTLKKSITTMKNKGKDENPTTKSNIVVLINRSNKSSNTATKVKDL